MKLGNVVLRCAFWQIFIVFALYSYAQSADEDVHRYKMIEAINSGNFEGAAKEIIYVKDWTFDQFNEKSFLDLDSVFSFINYAEFSNLSKSNVDSLFLYVVDELTVFAFYLVEERDYQSAINILNYSLNIQQQILGKNHYEYAIGLNNLATMYYYIGDYIQMDLLYKEALEIVKSVFGIHPM